MLSRTLRVTFGEVTLPHQPFRDEVGTRRRSPLSYFYVGVVFSFLAVVLAERLPNNLRHDLDMSRAAGTPDPRSSTLSPGLSFAKAVGFPNLTKPEAPKSGSALSVGSSGGKHRLRDQIPKCWSVASPSSISLRTLGPSCRCRAGRNLGD
jgi:hypothetical protein